MANPLIRIIRTRAPNPPIKAEKIRTVKARIKPVRTKLVRTSPAKIRALSPLTRVEKIKVPNLPVRTNLLIRLARTSQAKTRMARTKVPRIPKIPRLLRLLSSPS